MAGRAIWKGSVSFGGISVPVRLSPAVREERMRFHLLHRADGVRLTQVMVCGFDHRTVPPEEQAKGFEVEEGKFLLIDPEELEAVADTGSRAIEVRQFAPASGIDPVHLDHPYNLEPDGPLGGYAELAELLGELGVAGICGWTMRGKGYFGALTARGGALRLTTLRHSDEVIGVQSLELPEIPVTEREVSIGLDLIGRLAAPFEPGKYVDEHQERLRGLIERKARGEKVAHLRPRTPKPTPPDKLLEALEASLRKAG